MGTRTAKARSHLKEAEHEPRVFPLLYGNEVLVDHCGAMVDDLAEARDHAARVVRSLTMARSLEDLRGWVLHVTTTSVMSSSSSPSQSCSASPIEVAMLAVSATHSPASPMRGCFQKKLQLRDHLGPVSAEASSYARTGPNGSPSMGRTACRPIAGLADGHSLSPQDRPCVRPGRCTTALIVWARRLFESGECRKSHRGAQTGPEIFAR